MSRKYSVLMSVYKQESPSWLSYAIQSILEQTVAPDEFVIIKDGPLTDDLNKTINSFREEYPKLFKISSFASSTLNLCNRLRTIE